VKKMQRNWERSSEKEQLFLELVVVLVLAVVVECISFAAHLSEQKTKTS